MFLIFYDIYDESNILLNELWLLNILYLLYIQKLFDFAKIYLNLNNIGIINIYLYILFNLI